jgi:hypothetical protein
MKQAAAPVEIAQRHFWNALELQRQLLLDLVKDPAPLGSASFGEASDPWTLAVRKALFAAYDHACPRATPRQIEAYSLGLRRLRPKVSKSKTSNVTS